MRKFLLLFLIIIQSLFLCANAGQTNDIARVLNKNTHYIQTSEEPNKKFSVNLQNCNDIIKCLNSKTETIFAFKDSTNIDGIFIGFANSDFKNRANEYKTDYNYIFCEFHNIISFLDSEIHTRAP